jgi:hypothetical protein
MVGIAMKTLTVILDGGPDTDTEEVAGLAEELRRRLLELDVEAVDLVRTDDIPMEAKPLEAFSLGALAVTAAAGTVKAVVGLVRAWITARPIRGAKVTVDGDSLELTGASAADLERLARAFIDRHISE